MLGLNFSQFEDKLLIYAKKVLIESFVHRNTTVEEFYKFEEDSNSNAYYYLNNFNSLPISGVTLFELTGEMTYDYWSKELWTPKLSS